MALDNAQFIAELSITDPPGTDPLSQGDDQIRTIKRATQQSFPNIDKAVTLTADQMLQMAIKNEANVFTTSQTIQNAGLLLNDTLDGQSNTINFRRNGLNNWRILELNDAGGNDLELIRHDALGVTVDRPFTVDFTTGIVDFAQPPTVQGAPLWVAGELRMFVSAQTPGTNWFKADGLNGTVNLSSRFLGGSGGNMGTVGTLRDPNLNATAAAGTTGSTAISAAQMASHRHRIRSGSPGGLTDTILSFASSQRVVGASRNTPGSAFIDVNSGGQQFIENTGSGSGHTHTSPAQAVSEDSTDVNSVRPRSMSVDMFQYVP